MAAKLPININNLLHHRTTEQAREQATAEVTVEVTAKVRDELVALLNVFKGKMTSHAAAYKSTV